MSAQEPSDSTDPEGDATAWLRHFASLLEAAGLPAVLIGGQARNFWTEPRATRDYDFTIPNQASRLMVLLALLKREGYVSKREQGMNQPSGPDFLRLEHPETGDAIDFQVSKTPFQDSVVLRGQKLDPGQFLAVATPEDLIVFKLIANRHKDQVDVHDLAQLADLDWAYIEYWAEVWELGPRLQKLRSWPA